MRGKTATSASNSKAEILERLHAVECTGHMGGQSNGTRGPEVFVHISTVHSKRHRQALGKYAQ